MVRVSLKFIQFIIFCFLLFIYLLNFVDLSGDSNLEVDKYSLLAQKYEANLDHLMGKYQEFDAKYTAEGFISKFLNLEENRIKEQEEFNNKIIFSAKLPIQENGLSINIYNRDWMLLASVASQWCIDYIFLKMHSSAWRCAFQDLCLQQPKILHDLLEKLDEAVEQKSDAEIDKSAEEINKFISKSFKMAWVKYFCAMSVFAVSANLVYRVKNHYLLNSCFQQNLLDFAFMNTLWKADKNPTDNSLMTFLSDKAFAGLSVDVIQTTGLDVATSLLCDYGLVPYWVKDNKFDLFRRFVFTGIFIWWMQKKICKPIIFNYLTVNRKNLKNILNKIDCNDFDQQKLAYQELTDILNKVPENSFSLMEMGMRKKFAQYQTVLSVITLVPVAYTVGLWLYNLNKGE